MSSSGTENLEIPRYLLGKEIHQIEPKNSADLPGIQKTETIIAYNEGSDEALKHPDKVQIMITKSQSQEEGSIGMKSHESIKKGVNRPGTPIPPKRTITKFVDWKKINK